MRLARSIVVLLLVLIGVASAQPPPPPTGVFSPTQPVTSLPLTVTKSGTGTGTVSGPAIDCGTTCATSYVQGVTTILFATPASGSVFAGWSGACTGTGSCSVSMSAPAVVTATFTGGTFTTYNLAWNHDGLNLTNFSLERRTPCSTGTFNVLFSPISTDRAYSDTTALTGTQYEYRIDAVNGIVASAYSNLLCTPSGDPPGTITADTCSQADVQAAFNSVVPTTPRVRIPAGDCSWTGQAALTLPTGIVSNFSIVGAGDNTAGVGGGTPPNRTRIRDDNIIDQPLLFINATPLPYSSVVRIAGFHFQQETGQLKNLGFLNYVGFNRLRMDHNTFVPSVPGFYDVNILGATGVIDHNHFFGGGGGTNPGVNLQQNVGSKGAGIVGDWGDYAWSQPTAFGSDGFLFFEDNIMEGAGIFNCTYGGRVVLRHNTVHSFITHGHEEGTGRTRGCRALEVYENSFTSTTNPEFAAGNHDNGPGLFWNNTLATPYNNFILFYVARHDIAAGFRTFPDTYGYCGTLVNGVSSNIDENSLAPTGYRCLDQPGVGQGDLLQNDFPTIHNAATGATGNVPGIWPRQAVDPIYEWGTVGFTGSPSTRMVAGYDFVGGVVENRDYYMEAPSTSGVPGVFQGTSLPGTCTPKQGFWRTDLRQLFQCTSVNVWTFYYTPFTYPHPLTLVP